MPAVVKLLGREGWKWQWDGLGKSSNGRGALLITGTASKIP